MSNRNVRVINIYGSMEEREKVRKYEYGIGQGQL